MKNAETKLLNENREVQIRIALIQERINSIWKKPSLINKNIQAEFVINLAPSGEILSFDLISSSGEKVFDDSALAALSKIYFITEIWEGHLNNGYFFKKSLEKLTQLGWYF